MADRKSFDLDAYIRQVQNGPCFICEMAAGRLNGNHIIYQDEAFIAFLNKYPVLYGYALVAPVKHREQATGDFTMDEYLALQRAVYRVAEAVRRSVATERVYIFRWEASRAIATFTGILPRCRTACPSSSSNSKR